MSKLSKKDLSPRERLFCYHCLQTGSPKEAALRAGYPLTDAENQGVLLMMKPEITAAMEEMAAAQAQRACLRDRVKEGLLRLAFDPCTDGVRLVREGDSLTSGELEGMNLYTLAQLKRTKDGLEAVFFDRFKALEKLYEICREEESASASENSFYAALRQSAQELEKPERHG